MRAPVFEDELVPPELNTVPSRWRTLRKHRGFVPAAIAVPVLALSGGGLGVYAAWDGTRIDVPSVVGQQLPGGSNALQDLRLSVDEPQIPDETLGADCYVISAQSVPAGTRVVPEDTTVAVSIEPSDQSAPRLVGMPFSDAVEELTANCLHEEASSTWCVPADFSGGLGALSDAELTKDTGFFFDEQTELLTHRTLVPDPSWTVCDQDAAPGADLTSESTVGLVLTVPLTTVPTPPTSTLSAVLASLTSTADGCELDAVVETTFASNPAAIVGKSRPSMNDMAEWQVTSSSPAVGRAVLCGTSVGVSVAGPATTRPQRVGRHHVPERSGAATATTATLVSAGLLASCSGKGTVTKQVPEAEAPVPAGTNVLCVAELVMPSLIGLDPVSAGAALAAAGISGTAAGAGIVVSQNPIAGSIVTSSQSVSYLAQAPQPVPFYGGGGSSFANCSEARAAGAAPLYRGDPGYQPKLDRDGDGVACE